jgi:hypothetical protein
MTRPPVIHRHVEGQRCNSGCHYARPAPWATRAWWAKVGAGLLFAAAFLLGACDPLWDAMPWAVR